MDVMVKQSADSEMPTQGAIAMARLLCFAHGTYVKTEGDCSR